MAMTQNTSSEHVSPSAPASTDTTQSDHPALESPVEDHRGGGGLDRVVFGITAALAVGFLVWGFVDTGSLGGVSSSALDWTVTSMGWLFVLTASSFVVFVIWLALGR
ncbi:MAG: choline/carnitine/betaine transporter, partial [Marmoricola sp.]|nr:choline/carnitine/betaine transporter [Marmoricola sp.]